MATDLEIARSIPLRPIHELCVGHGLPAESVVALGAHKAKLDHRLAARPPRPNGRTVLVTAITPTPAGEGKTVHTIGLGLALNRLGKRAVSTIRQPSMGPVFGIKGGAAGGGRSQVVPMEAINLHLTGDFHAVSAATNLCAAALDTSCLLDNPLRIDPATITLRRVVDMNDRALREIQIGLGGAKNGIPRTSGFDITSASEVMAVLGLCRDLADLRARLGRMVVAANTDGAPVTAEDLGVAGAMAVLVREAIDPNVLQTTEGTLAFVHTGPFANIAHGNSSVIADLVAGANFDYVVTEGGFGADMGAEKFFNIKSRVSGRSADCALLVATVRALKVHSGRFAVAAGKIPAALGEEDLDALAVGAVNLDAQIANVAAHGVPVVVAINRFPGDTARELDYVRRRALDAGAVAAEISEVHGRGGEGGTALAEAVVRAAESGTARPRPLYALEASIPDKIEILAKRLYGAGAVEFSALAAAQAQRLTEQGFGALPICVAKTQYSLSHDPNLKGRPVGYTFPIRGLRLAAGAGFLVAYAGDVMTMPGLGRTPAYRDIDLDARGEIVGLS